MSRILFGLAALVSLSSAAIVEVTGSFKCDGHYPDQTVTVELMEKDLDIAGVDPDDLLGDTTVFIGEKFVVSGEQREYIGHLEPYLLIYHRCGKNSERENTETIRINLEYVEDNFPFFNAAPHKEEYDIGEIDLSTWK